MQHKTDKYAEESIEDDFDKDSENLIGEFYDDKNYHPDDSDIQDFIDDAGFFGE